MNQTVLDWLLEEKNPEVRLRTLKEFEQYPQLVKAYPKSHSCKGYLYLNE